MRRWSKVILVVLGALVAIPVTTWVVGMALPEAHVATVEVQLAAPPSAVWSRIADPVSSVQWRESVQGAERLADRDGLPCFRETSSFGDLLYVQEVRVEPSRLVTRIVDNDDFGGRWEYELTPQGSGTRLVITERGEVYNPFFRAMSRFVFGHDATMKTYVRELAAALDTGA